jgi:hypothetical protein
MRGYRERLPQPDERHVEQIVAACARLASDTRRDERALLVTVM